MGSPIMTLTNTTATGDVITGPGCPTLLCKGLPVATMTNLVAGATCVSGTITGTVSPTVLGGSLPIASIGAVVTGVSAVGAPVSTTCAITSNANDLG